MIINETSNRVETSGVEEVVSFTIEANARAFEILSSGIYTDKVKSIIQELSCNAWDAHVMGNNTQTPFSVHLPSAIEPYYSIRDYGIGLSHADMYGIYRTYFRSNKRNNNEVIGCLGLGSKTPLCYVEQFSVTSYFEGMKRIYNVFINEKGMPDIAKMHEEPTTEHNGLEISFPVENNFNEFLRKSLNVYKYFPVKPVFTGDVSTVIIAQTQYLAKFDTWGFRKSTDYDTTVNCIMGNVCYNADDFDKVLLTDEERAVMSMPIDMFFKLGQLEFAASRERLSYTKATKETIINRAKMIVQGVKDDIATRLAACTCAWEARCLLHAMTSGELKSYKNFIDKSTITWNGTSVSNVLFNFTNSNQLDFNLLTTYSEFKRRKGYCLEVKETLQIRAEKATVFFYRDTKQYKERLIYFAKQNEHLTPVMLDTDDPANIQKFMDKIGYNKPILGVSTLVMPPAALRTKVVNVLNKVSVVAYKGNGKKDIPSSWWTETTADKNSFAVYLPIDRYTPNGNGSRVGDYVEYRLLTLKMIGVDCPVVYGVKQRSCNDVDILKNWITLDNYVTKCFNEYIDKNPVIIKETLRSIAMQKFTDTVDYYKRSAIMKVIKDEKMGPYLFNNKPELVDENMREWLSFDDRKVSAGMSAELRSRLMDWLLKLPDCNDQVQKIMKNVNLSIDKVFAHYPLLYTICDTHRITCEQIFDYILLIDNNFNLIKMSVEE